MKAFLILFTLSWAIGDQSWQVTIELYRELFTPVRPNRQQMSPICEKSESNKILWKPIRNCIKHTKMLKYHYYINLNSKYNAEFKIFGKMKILVNFIAYGIKNTL